MISNDLDRSTMLGNAQSMILHTRAATNIAKNQYLSRRLASR